MKAFRHLMEAIKVEHTLFALPLALSGMVLGAKGLPPGGKVLWVSLAMVGARTAAMAFNRLADEAYDARNPRTRGRPLPSRRIGRGSLWGLTVAGVGLTTASAWRLNPLALRLAPLALGWVLFYSFTKRFTWACHLCLGLAVALAPVGGWIGVRGDVGVSVLLLGGATALWVAGFDVIYGCLDYDFDRAVGLHSLPVKLGIQRALGVAALFHLGALGLFLACGLSAGLGLIWMGGLGVVAGLLGAEHFILHPYNPSKVPVAFFPLNAAVSLVVFSALSLDLWFGGGR